MTTILLLLIASALLYGFLSRWSRHERVIVGLGDETIESTDDAAMSMRVAFAAIRTRG